MKNCFESPRRQLPPIVAVTFAAALWVIPLTHDAWLDVAVVAVEPAAVELQQLTRDGFLKQRPAWSPDGRWLLFTRVTSDSLYLYKLDSTTGEQTRVTENKIPEFDAVWSPDQQRIAFSLDTLSGQQGDVNVVISKIDGTDLQPFAGPGDKLSHEEGAAYSPDGKWLAFTSTREGNQELFVKRLDGQQELRLTSDPCLDAHPCWSPDGTRIAFATDRWGDLELAVINADGSQLIRLTESAGLDDEPSWSPDGKRLAFTSNRDGNFEVYLLKLATRAAINVSRQEALDNFPAWRPDGRLGFVSNRDGGFEFYELPASAAAD